MSGGRFLEGSSDVWLRLRALLEEVGCTCENGITDEARVADIVGLDSVAFVEVIVSLEEEFHIGLDPLALLEREKLADVVEYVSAVIADPSRRG